MKIRRKIFLHQRRPFFPIDSRALPTPYSHIGHALLYFAFTSLARIDDVAASNLALVHHVVHLLKLAHADDFEWCIDETTAEEVNGLAGVLAIPNVGSPDRLRADDGLEDWCAEVCTGWETDGDDGPAGSEILSCLLEWLLVDGH